MGILKHTLSWLQTVGRKYHRSIEQAAKAADREWKEGHWNSGKWESWRQTDMITVVKSVKQRYSWAHLQDFPLHFATHTHATWQSVKGSVCLQVYSSSGYNFFSFEFSAEINYFEATDNVRWSASEEKFNIYREERGELTTLRWLVTKLCGYLVDGKLQIRSKLDRDMKDKGMLKTFRLGAEINIHKIPTALSISIKKKWAKYVKDRLDEAIRS